MIYQKIVTKDTNMVLYTDDTSILVTDSNKVNINININRTFRDINAWFKDNLLTMNHTKSQYLEFKTKYYCNVNAEITYDQKCTTKASEMIFLGVIIHDTLSWKQHIDQLVNKMSVACYAVQNIISLVSPDTLRIIYFAYIHSILSYGIIFWGNSSYSNKVFILQKKKNY